jgi:CRISPR-associated protein Csd1
MGIWQNLTDSYAQNADALKSTYPLSTTSISNNADFIAVIVIDGNGKFVRSDKIEKRSKATNKSPENPLVNITIPVTEESLGRSSGISPHPVFDQYEYLKGIVDKSDEYIKNFYDHCDYVREYIKKLKGGNKKSESRLKKWKDYYDRIKKLEDTGKKYDAYIVQLKDFAESAVFATEQVKAIYQYVSKRTIASDLSGMNLKDKTNIVFQVEIPGYSQTKVWEDERFFDAWHQYYSAGKTEKQDTQSLDYISGTFQPLATSHPKKISNGSANSKLVSDNDDKNYTFRGKFRKSSEAVSIGYETTQKAHQFLRYLINDRGHYCGEQVIFSFTVGSTENSLPAPLDDSKSIWDIIQEPQTKTENDSQITLRAETGFDYADALKQSLAGFGYGMALEQHTKTAVIALDAATTGRLSITFYRELGRNEYLEKISNWHSGCKWNQMDEQNKKYAHYIGAPSVGKIIEAVLGNPRGGKDESYTKIKKSARERLLRCIFDGAPLPTDYVVSAVRRASNPLSITKDGKFDRNGFERILSTSCALVRKYYQQRIEEEYKLSIEMDRKDRDYLFGRLLGAADKLEEYALFKKEKDRIVTAAIRHMQTFAQRPFRTWQTIHSCLNPYIQKVKGGFAFNEIQAVMNQFAANDYENDTPLNGSYLIGYYHERAHIDSLVEGARNRSKATGNTETEENNGGQ